MKRFFIAAVIACFSVFSLSAEAPEGRLLRFPATNGTDVVFSYAGDLYRAPLKGGEAVRLTAHVGNEIFAHYSPDGQTIAFTGQYDGNTEVYIMPAEGGTPQRITYTSTNARDDLGDRMGPNNIVMGWTPDGKYVMYRNRINSSFDGKLWKAPVDGGMSEALPLPEGGFCSWSPDGSKLAYNRTFREFRTWKYYTGGQADDIWIYDGKSVSKITDNINQDVFPMWIGDEIYYVSDRDHWMNVFVYNTVSGETAKVTDFKEYDVKFPSTDGKHIVFENAGWIYSLDPATKKYSKLDIRLATDGILARTEQKNVSNKVRSASISESADRIAVTARGEVFTVPVKAGVTKNISRTPGANERDAQYSPDGRYIAWISDLTGETELYLYNTADETVNQLTTGADIYISSIKWSPDGKTIVYSDCNNRLVAVSVPDGKKREITVCPERQIHDFSFSADSRWLAYSRCGKNEMGYIVLYNMETFEEIPVTENWYSSNSPVFSKDGGYLLFASSRDFNPIYSSVEWNHAFTDTESLYIVMLSKDGRSPLLPSDGETSNVGKAVKDAPKSKKSADSSIEESALKIDAEGIFQRIIKLPVGVGNFRTIHADAEGVWYGNKGASWYYAFGCEAPVRLFDGMMEVSGDKVIAMSHGNLSVMPCPCQKTDLGKPVDLSAMVATVDYTAEWAQIFDEAWRAFRDGFYTDNMHGIDWKAMRAKYEVLLPYVKSRLDLNYVIGEMISELTVGHSYVTPGEYPKAPRIQMGLLGAEISAADGVFRIDRIMKGAPYSELLRSPLSEPGMDVKEGDYIQAVDGVSCRDVNNFYELMVGKAGVLTELTVSATADGKNPRKAVFKPIADEFPLLHHEWVESRIEYVTKASGGRIGYVYIPDMSVEGLSEFARYYYPQLDREALIIDDRSNGGGNVSPMIIERLLRQPYRMTMYRTSSLNGTIPQATFYGPKVCLIDKYSASDGDLFPWSFKAAGVGKLIGTRTWGGIVGINGSLPYMDGTDIRVPFFTNYDSKTGEWIIENHGVDPDIIVDNDPIQQQAGIDQQLDRAIEELLKELENWQPLPGTPAPRCVSTVQL